MMQYRISFTMGDNQGESYPLFPEQVVSIGRSHSNTIRLSAPDISGKHIIIRTDKGGNITMEVLSSRTTLVNNNSVSIGDMLPLSVGSTVQMGSGTAFVILSEDVQAADASTDDDEKTVPPVSVQNLSELDKTTVPGNAATSIGKTSVDKTVPHFNESTRQNVTSEETIAFQTRVASDDEMDKIKKSIRSRQRKRTIMIAVPLFLFFVLAVFFYFYLRPVAEDSVTWPTDSKGETLSDYWSIAPYLVIYYPSVPGHVKKGDDSSFEVETRIGKLLDVRLHILAKTVKDPETLEKNHMEAFESWMASMEEQEATLSFAEDKKTIFVNQEKGAGVPVSYVSYTRRVNNDDFWGYAIFLRNEDNIHWALVEVELGDKWRSEDFMYNRIPGDIVYYDPNKKTEEHWEGTSTYRRNTTASEDLKEASKYMEREAPVYWGRIHYLLISALIKTTKSEKPDPELIANAKSMLVRLRHLQRDWYNNQRLAWQYAFRSENKETMSSIQDKAESIFTSEFQYSDFRYDLIKRKDWK